MLNIYIWCDTGHNLKYKWQNIWLKTIMYKSSRELIVWDFTNEVKNTSQIYRNWSKSKPCKYIQASFKGYIGFKNHDFDNIKNIISKLL